MNNIQIKFKKIIFINPANTGTHQQQTPYRHWHPSTTDPLLALAPINNRPLSVVGVKSFTPLLLIGVKSFTRLLLIGVKYRKVYFLKLNLNIKKLYNTYNK